MNHEIKKLALSDRDLFLQFIKSVDKEFTPSLSSHVDLNRFANKVLTVGHVISIINNNKISGSIAFYANDMITFKGYISFIATSNSMRNQGIASSLISLVIDEMRNSGMTCVGIHTNNPIASRIYQRLGFKVIYSQTYPNYIRQYLEMNLI